MKNIRDKIRMDGHCFIHANCNTCPFSDVSQSRDCSNVSEKVYDPMNASSNVSHHILTVLELPVP